MSQGSRQLISIHSTLSIGDKSLVNVQIVAIKLFTHRLSPRQTFNSFAAQMYNIKRGIQPEVSQVHEQVNIKAQIIL